jgi:hypothetical protein
VIVKQQNRLNSEAAQVTGRAVEELGFCRLMPLLPEAGELGLLPRKQFLLRLRVSRAHIRIFGREARFEIAEVLARALEASFDLTQVLYVRSLSLNFAVKVARQMQALIRFFGFVSTMLADLLSNLVS